MEKRIKIKSRITLWQFALALLAALATLVGVLYLIFSQNYLSHRTKSEGLELIGVLFLLAFGAFKSLTNKGEYLADIYITDYELKLVYKIQNTITRVKTVKKDNIKAFEVSATVDETTRGRYKKPDVRYKFFIDLYDGEDFFIDEIPDVILVEHNYGVIYRILDAAKYIPNFNFIVNAESKLIKAEFEYYRMFGKKLPFWTKCKLAFSSSPTWANVILFIILFALIFSSSIFAWSNIPTKLTPTEQQYIDIINNVSNYKKDYNKRIGELDRAKKLISTDPYLYYLYAYNYKKKKDYHAAIFCAKQGISLLGNKEIYYKQYKLLKPKTDIYLYETLGDCYAKLKNWENAVSAYTYVANSRKKPKYGDIYFSRGKAYFELKKYQEAKQDFLAHKKVILNYIETYSQKNWNWANTYTSVHLDNINKWIQACDAWSSYYNSTH